MEVCPGACSLFWDARSWARLWDCRFFSAQVWHRAWPGIAVIMQSLQSPSSLALRRRSCPFRRLYSIYSGVLCLNRSYSRYSWRLVSNSAGVSSWFRFGFRAFGAAFLRDLVAKRFRDVLDVFFVLAGRPPTLLSFGNGKVNSKVWPIAHSGRGSRILLLGSVILLGCTQLSWRVFCTLGARILGQVVNVVGSEHLALPGIMVSLLGFPFLALCMGPAGGLPVFLRAGLAPGPVVK